MTPFVLALVRRLAPERLGWPTTVAMHLPLSGAFSLAHLALTAGVYRGAGVALGGKLELA